MFILCYLHIKCKEVLFQIKSSELIRHYEFIINLCILLSRYYLNKNDNKKKKKNFKRFHNIITPIL